MNDRPVIAGVELGGTKAIATLWRDGAVLATERMATGSDPAALLTALSSVLGRWNEQQPIDALGVASFGPVSLGRKNVDYGCIRTTPKAGWTGVDIIAGLNRRLGVPVAIDTDVNAAGLAEARWGAGRGLSCLVYLTIGTGVGGGAIINGRPVHGRLHPEMGHMLLPQPRHDAFAGTCPFHGDCAEGLLCGPALAERFGEPAEQVSADDPRWAAVRIDLAAFLVQIIHAYSPQRILVGGGVGMGQGLSLERVRGHIKTLLGGYYPELDDAALAEMVCHPVLGEDAGPLGAVALGLSLFAL